MTETVAYTVRECRALYQWLDYYQHHIPHESLVEKDWHVEFDLPENGMAMIHLKQNDTTAVIINCFTWDESYLLRKLTKFGDNHRWRAVSWQIMRRYLEFLSLTTPEYRQILKEDENGNATP